MKSPRFAALFTILVLCSFGSANALVPLPQSSQDKDKLKKELAKIEEQLEREVSRANEKLRPALSEEWAKIPSELPADWKSALAALGVAEKSALAAARAAQLKSDKTVSAAFEEFLKERVGPLIAEWLAPTMTRFALDSDATEDGGFDPALVWEATFSDRLNHKDFDAAYDKVLAEAFAPKIAKLSERKKELTREIAKIEEIEAARLAGIPHGMVRVPAGVHRIGLDEKECKELTKLLGYSSSPGRLIKLRLASPSRTEKLPEFFLDRYEVTCEWYRAYMEDQATAKPPMDWVDASNEGGWKLPEGYEKRPVTGISLYEAIEFAAWMGRRLPTEFEWEAAARYSQNSTEPKYWPWGEWKGDESPANWAAQMRHPLRSSLKIGQPQVLPVGTFEQGASALGLHDLSGNAWEWTTSLFTPYPGFKTVTIDKSTLSIGDFPPEYVTIRGGDALKEAYIVSSVWRFSTSPTERAQYLGFRTAASAVRGKDMVEWFSRENRIYRHLINTDPMPYDIQKGRKHAQLTFDDPEGYSALTSGGFVPGSDLPTRARHVLAIRREIDGIRNLPDMQALAKDGPALLAYLRVDHPVQEPPLPEGEYLVLWETGVIPPLKEGEKRDPKKKPEKLPDALLFKAINVSEVTEPVRFTAFPPPVVGTSQPTRIVPYADKNQVEVVLSFPVSRNDKRKGFLISLPLTFAEEGTAAKLR